MAVACEHRQARTKGPRNRPAGHISGGDITYPNHVAPSQTDLMQAWQAYFNVQQLLSRRICPQLHEMCHQPNTCMPCCPLSVSSERVVAGSCEQRLKRGHMLTGTAPSTAACTLCAVSGSLSKIMLQVQCHRPCAKRSAHCSAHGGVDHED